MTWTKKMGSGSSSSYITGKTINCLGDSLTAGNTGGSTPWTTFLQSNYSCTVRNYGMSGTTLANNGTTNGMITRYPNMDNNADIVMVWGGWNDINQSIALGTFADRVDTTFYGALHLMLDGLQTKYTGKKIFIGTILDHHHTWTTVQNYNKAVRDVAEYWAVPIIEFAFLGFGSRNNASKSTLMVDDTHPNTAGNKIVADVIAKFINSH